MVSQTPPLDNCIFEINADINNLKNLQRFSFSQKDHTLHKNEQQKHVQCNNGVGEFISVYVGIYWIQFIYTKEFVSL